MARQSRDCNIGHQVILGSFHQLVGHSGNQRFTTLPPSPPLPAHPLLLSQLAQGKSFVRIYTETSGGEGKGGK